MSEEASQPGRAPSGPFNRIAAAVIRRPAIAVGVIVAITAALSTQLSKLRPDPSVENLIASFEGNERAEAAKARFASDFGGTERVIVLLVEAEDVLATGPLGHLDALTHGVEQLPWAESVLSLTRTPIPRRVQAQAPSGFDDLEGELEDEGEEGDSNAAQDAAYAALTDLVAADPERFPQGITGLATLQDELRVNAIVEEGQLDEDGIEELRRTLSQTRLLDGRLISRDRTVAVSAIVLQPGLEQDEITDALADLEGLQAELPAPEGVHVHVGGLPYLRASIVNNIRQDQKVLIPMTLLVCMLLLALTLRWLAGVLLPILAVGLTALVVVGGMALAGEPMNILNNIIPTLLIIIGISDSIHLIGRYREELAAGEEKTDAIRISLASMAAACLLTSLTTAVGLAALVISQTNMLRHFGVTAAIGVIVAYAVTIFFIPPVLTWVKVPKVSSRGAGEDRDAFDARLGALTRAVIGARWPVIGLAAVLLGGSAFVAHQYLEVDHALLDQFDPEDPVFQTTLLLEEHLGGVRPLEVSLVAPDAARFEDPAVLSAIDDATRAALEDEAAIGSLSSSALLRQTLYLLTLDDEVWEAPFANAGAVRALRALVQADNNTDPLATWLSEDGTHFRVQIRVRDVGAQASMRFIHGFETDLRERLNAAGGDDVEIAFMGEAYDGSQGMDAVVTDLLSSLLTAALIIFVLLTLLFRSVKLGLLSIPPNIIPLAFTMAYMVLRGIPLNAATVIIFSVSLGLAVDGSIHVLARFREETLHHQRDVDEALVRAAQGTGRAIVISSITLMAGFAVLRFSNFVPVQRFGELIAVTVASCLFATLVVQPALLRAATRPSPKEAEGAQSGVGTAK